MNSKDKRVKQQESDLVEGLKAELQELAEQADTGQFSTALYAAKLIRATSILKQLKEKNVGYEISGPFLATAARKAGLLDSTGTGTEGVDVRLGLGAAAQGQLVEANKGTGDAISAFVAGSSAAKK